MVHKTNCRKNKNYLNNNLHICLVESQDATTTTTTTTSASTTIITTTTNTTTPQ